MAAIPKHRGAIVGTAALLFRRQGYAATGINEIADRSGAPKGSLYHYFPGGKEAIGEAAVRMAGGLVEKTLAQLFDRHRTTAALVKAYGSLLAEWMAKSDFRDGCPITTVLLEAAPASPGITAAGAAAFSSWREVVSRALLRDGFSPAQAGKLASLVVSAIEGALIQARVEQSARPIADTTEGLAKLLRAQRREK